MEDNHIKPIGETLQDKINLLQEELFKEKEKNKELEVINKIQEYRISVIDERELIPKSKVEELKDKIHRELEINAVTRRDLIYIDLNLARIDQYFNELLEKE